MGPCSSQMWSAWLPLRSPTAIALKTVELSGNSLSFSDFLQPRINDLYLAIYKRILFVSHFCNLKTLKQGKEKTPVVGCWYPQGCKAFVVLILGCPAL